MRNYYAPAVEPVDIIPDIEKLLNQWKDQIFSSFKMIWCFNIKKMKSWIQSCKYVNQLWMNSLYFFTKEIKSFYNYVHNLWNI